MIFSVIVKILLSGRFFKRLLKINSPLSDCLSIICVIGEFLLNEQFSPQGSKRYYKERLTLHMPLFGSAIGIVHPGVSQRD